MISAEAKSNIANALYMEARDRENALDELPGTEGSDVWSNLESYVDVLGGYVCALSELGLDSDELRWIHDRIEGIRVKAEQMLLEVQTNA